MRYVNVERDGVKIRIVEMFRGPGSGYELVPEWLGRTMPVIVFEVTREDGRTVTFEDYNFYRRDLCVTDDEAIALINRARSVA